MFLVSLLFSCKYFQFLLQVSTLVVTGKTGVEAVKNV